MFKNQFSPSSLVINAIILPSMAILSGRFEPDSCLFLQTNCMDSSPWNMCSIEECLKPPTRCVHSTTFPKFCCRTLFPGRDPLSTCISGEFLSASSWICIQENNIHSFHTFLRSDQEFCPKNPEIASCFRL